MSTSLRASCLASLIAAAALAAGCASTPAASSAPAAPATADCGQLRGAIASAEKTKREATERQQDAWKAVIPFAVVARYASAGSDVADADARLNDLRVRSARQGCPS